MRLLVTIANHGTGNRKYLEKLLASYRSMPYEITIVVLSNIPKDDLGPDIKVAVGAPTENPWSLPFAGLPIFEEELDNYDYFIYTEDDILVSHENIEAFIASIKSLKDDEIAGFIRTEIEPNGNVHYCDSHSFFRWIPSSVRERDGKLWADYSNLHSAFYIATQEQVRNGLKSGGLSKEAHEGRFDMLCSAATDIYTQCGLKRLLCIDALNELEVHHLSDKYIGLLGTPKPEFDWQLEAMRKVSRGELPTDELFDPETNLLHGYGSKFLREVPDSIINELSGDNTSEVLFWGSGDGFLEEDFAKKTSHNVTIEPMNSVMGESCEQRGLTLDTDKSKKFDTIVVIDSLHLIDDPKENLKKLTERLKDNGKVIARIPNLQNIRTRRKRAKIPRFAEIWDSGKIGARPYTKADIVDLASSANLTNIQIKGNPQDRAQKYNKWSLGFFSLFLSEHYYLTAKKA